MTREWKNKEKIFQWTNHFHEYETLYGNLYNTNLEDNKDNEIMKISLQKAIDSKNARDQIHSNKKIQRIIIIRTIILWIWAILQILTNIFDKEISSRNLCFKLYITIVILSFTIIWIVMYRYSTKDK